MNDLADILMDQGFVKIQRVLDPRQATALARGADELLSRPSRPFADYLSYERNKPDYLYGATFENEDWKLAVDAIGNDAAFDDALEAIFAHPTVKSIAERTIGPGYKLISLNLRRATIGSVGQCLHQDPSEQLGMSILVSTVDGEGATVFWPRSHRWPIRYNDFGWKWRPSRIEPVLGDACGEAGDTFFFFHRTWHGRRTSPNREATSILLYLTPVGFDFILHETPKGVLDRVGPELRRLLDFNVGVERIDSSVGRVVWPGPEPFPGRPPAMEALLREKLPLKPFSPWRAVKAWGQAKDAVRTSKLRSALRSFQSRDASP